ncbi:MAG: helix-hairpin-helix domain-containing protein [Gammaproteobacteria bacterium]
MRTVTSMLLSAGLALSSAIAWAGPVDINTADASTLARELNGVGPARAQAIVAYRTEHGPFKSVDDLALVKNMPRKVIDNNRELLQVEGGKAAPRPEGRPAAKADTRAARAEPKPEPKAAPKP